MRRYLTLLAALGAVVLAAFLAACGPLGQNGADEATPEVFVADVSQTTGRNDELTAGTVSYLERVISRAAEEEAEAVVIELSTAGGRLDHTQDIVGLMGDAEQTPIFVYVTPRGSQAASAGTFILMGSDVAAMAPDTRTGAATPVTFFGGDIPGDLGEKARNDAVALITSLAETHDRNVEWAEDAVREAAAIGAQEALEIGVIEYVEPNVEALLEAADGITVEPKGITLNTAGATLVAQNLTFQERFGFSRWYVIVPGVLLGLLAIGFTFAAIKSSRARVSTGREGMVGEVGTVRRPVGKDGGLVFVHGELWTALPEEPQMAPIEPGTEVEITGFRRTAIVVRPTK